MFWRPLAPYPYKSSSFSFPQKSFQCFIFANTKKFQRFIFTNTKKIMATFKMSFPKREGDFEAVVEVTNIDQAKMAESAGASCVLVSEPARQGISISRMLDPLLIREIKKSIKIPIMARARVGHFVEAKILVAAGVDFIDESEVLSSADHSHFINKHDIGIPVICGCKDLGEALKRVSEGASGIRIQGDSNIANTVNSVRNVMGAIRVLESLKKNEEVFKFCNDISAPYSIVDDMRKGDLPVAYFAAGGITTPADVALMICLGCYGVFIDSDVFNCPDAERKLRAMVQATKEYGDAVKLEELSQGLSHAAEG